MINISARMRALLALLLLLASPALAQTPGTLNLSGPSTGGPVVTTATINAAVNAQLGAKADAVNPAFTGTVTAGAGAFTGTLTLGAGGSGSVDIFQSGTGNLRMTLGGASSIWVLKGSGVNGQAQFTPGNGQLSLLPGTSSASLKLNGLTSGSVTIEPQDIAGAWTWRIPNSAGTKGALLRTDGANISTWVSQARSLDESGAVGDGTTDDAAAINGFLVTLSPGATVYVPAKPYLIDTNNLNVPSGVRLVGATGSLSKNAAGTLSGGSTFLINPAFSVTINSTSTTLDNIFIRAKGMTASPTAAQAIAAVAGWGAATNTGITVAGGGDGAYIKNTLVEGFHTGVKIASGRVYMDNVWIDSYIGLDIKSASDNTYLNEVRVQPFYSLQTTTALSGAWARPGIAFNLHDGNTGLYLLNCFSFMFANGLVVRDAGSLFISNYGTEWQPTFGNGITGTVGMRLTGHDPAFGMINSYLNGGYDTPLSVESFGEAIFTQPFISTANTTGIYLGGQTAIPTTITIAGTPSAGNTIPVTITSAAITGSPLVLTYTVVAGDTTATIASAIAEMISETQALITPHFSASLAANGSGNVITVFWPASVTATVTTAPTGGGVTAATGTAAVQAGSYGSITALNAATISGVPIITAGDSVGLTGKWNISAPMLSSGPASLASGWLSYPSASESPLVLLSGIQWSANTTAGHVTSCGTTPAISGTDGRGVVTIGSGTVTSCTVAFTTPFPSTPNVQLTTDNASISAAVTAVSASGFTAGFSASLGSGHLYFAAAP